MTTPAHPARARWRVLLLAALTVVLALLLPAVPASAATLPAAETRVGVSGPATAVVVGVHECITAGQRPVRGPSQPQMVVGNCVAAEGGSSRAATAARSCSVNSFTAGTLVLLADGRKKPISDVEVGELVLATDPETGETAAKPVEEVIVHGGDHTMVDVTLADGSQISATDEHPFWNVSDGEFTYAVDLEAGEQVLTADGGLLTITRVRAYAEDLTAYNLAVEGIHTYYAGTTPVLVHNTCAAGGGGSVDNIAPSDAARLQQFADTTGRPITVVGSRASGNTGPLSDWDYLVDGGWSSALRSKGTWLLPRGPRAGGGTGRDFLQGPLDPELPWVTVAPRGG